MHFGVDNMRKKKIWNCGCAVLMFLVICTVLSIRIEKLMQMEVKTTRGTVRQGEEVKEILLPASAVKGSGAGDSFVQYVEKERGVFGNTVWRVVERPVIYLGEENGYAVVPEANLTDGIRVVDIIYYSTYPVREGDIVTVPPLSEGRGGVLLYVPGAVTAEEVRRLDKKGWMVEAAGAESDGQETDWLLIQKKSGEPIYFHAVSEITVPLFGRSIEGEYLDLSAYRNMLSQTGWISFFIALIPAGVICLGIIWRMLCSIQKRDMRRGLAGIMLFGGFLAVLYTLTGQIEIPRQFLPEQQLFDIAHYAEGIRGFFCGMGEVWKRQSLYLELRDQYKTALMMYGVLTAVAWSVTVGMVVWGRRVWRRS